MNDTKADNEHPTGIPDAERGRTAFSVKDVPPSRRDHFKRLRKHNIGWRSGSRSSQKHYGGIERDVGVIATRLDATDYQQDRTQKILEQIDINEDISRVSSVEAVILAVFSMVIDADRTRYDPTDENETPTSVTRDDTFGDIREDFDVDRSEIRRVREAIRELDKVDL